MTTLSAALQRNAERYPDRTAVLDSGESLSWSGLVERVGRAATVLKDLGVGKGERYAIIGLNSPHHAELVYAGYWSGAIPVPVNYRLAAPEIRDILEDANCKVVVIDAQFLPLLETTQLRAWRSRCCYLGSSNDKNRSYEAKMATAAISEPVATQAEEEAILLYTGGTTGKSKGVPLSHRNILANASQIASVWPASADDVVLHVPPMFHSAELVKMVYLLSGATHVYLPRFEPELLLRTIEKYRVTFALLVPTIIMMLLESGLLGKFDISSLKQIIYGASSMPAPWIKKTMKAFPAVQIAQGYGLTETAPLLSMLDHASHIAALDAGNPQHLASCGRPLKGVDIRIVDNEGRALPTGAEGDILVKGDNVFQGYINRPGLNAEVLRDGWFNTGDIGYLDEDGYLYLKGRKHDLIISGGEKVYATEVEAVINQHPRVAECAVIGVADQQYGERVHAVVVACSGKELNQAELRDYCREHIGGFKVPREIDFVEALPKSALGKILKTELRRRYDNTSQN